MTLYVTKLRLDRIEEIDKNIDHCNKKIHKYESKINKCQDLCKLNKYNKKLAKYREELSHLKSCKFVEQRMIKNIEKLDKMRRRGFFLKDILGYSYNNNHYF